MKALSESGRVFWRKYSARKVLRQIIADNNLNSAAYVYHPPHAAANPTIQQMYINGHFCYAFKFGIMTGFLKCRLFFFVEKNPFSFLFCGLNIFTSYFARPPQIPAKTFPF